MEKKQILGAVVVFILILCALFLNYKLLDVSTEFHSGSRDNSNNGHGNDSSSDSINDSVMKYLLNNMNAKMCCEEIGGTISGKSCVFEDLDGTELEINYRYLEDYNGKNYCTDEYFDRK